MLNEIALLKYCKLHKLIKLGFP